MLAHLEIRSHKSGMGREGQKNIPKLREHEVNEKTIPNFVNGNRMKKSIPIIWERESEAFILGNGREREFPLTPVLLCSWCKYLLFETKLIKPTMILMKNIALN